MRAEAENRRRNHRNIFVRGLAAEAGLFKFDKRLKTAAIPSIMKARIKETAEEIREGEPMTVKECYEAIGGDYEGVMQRLREENRVARFAGRFLTDPNFAQLKEGLEAGDVQAAFRAAHTLKGVCQNLGFTGLYRLASEVTECLRSEDLAGGAALWPRLQEEYERTVEMIENLTQA
jgi:hypothetical protein